MPARCITPAPAATPEPVFAPARGALPALRRSLLAWYARARRDLPWRTSPNPYRVWVSEIMLQQTTVKTVVPRYRSFLRLFPTLRSLARAPLDRVLAAWSGLGYYSRARNLHAAAARVVRDHAGRFPRDLHAALRLPGVGRYTAAAILSIAHGLPLAVLDGNVARVLARLGALRGDPRSTRTRNRLQALADDLLDPRAPGDFNQAMMELGALVCTPTAPRCPGCPLARWCRALERGLTVRLPETATRPTARPETLVVALIERNGRVLLRQRPADVGLMPGLWEMPGWTLAAADDRRAGPARRSGGGARHTRAAVGAAGSPGRATTLTEFLQARLRAEVHPSAQVGGVAGQARHSIMNRRIRMIVCRASMDGRPAPAGRWRWVPRSRLGDLAASSMIAKALRAAETGRAPTGRPPTGRAPAS